MELIKEFLTVLQILIIYLGGIAILFLFSVWLISVTIPEDHCQENPDDIFWCD